MSDKRPGADPRPTRRDLLRGAGAASLAMAVPPMFGSPASAAVHAAGAPAPVSSTLAWKSTIALGERLRNAAQTCYETPQRAAFVIDNAQVRLVHGLRPGSGAGTQVASLLSSDGAALATETMDAVAVDAHGRTFRASLSAIPARVNQWRMGIYYTEVSFLELGLGRVGGSDDEIEVFGGFHFESDTEGWEATTQHLTPPVVEDGALVGTILDPTDPGLCIVDTTIDTGTGNVVRFRLRYTGSQCRGKIYYGTTTEPEFSESRSAAFDIVADGEFHDYLISIAGPNFSGPLTALRLDFDEPTVGDTFALDSIEIIDDSAVNLPVKLAKIYHVYGDRIYEEVAWYPTGELQLSDAYVEMSIGAQNVSGVRIGSSDGDDAIAPGDVVDLPAGEDDPRGLGWVGLGVRRAGTVGWVLPRTGDNGRVSVARSEDRWLVRHHAALGSGAFGPGDDIHVGHRLVASCATDFDDLRSAHDAESHPLDDTRITVADPDDATRFVGYEPFTGQYRFTVPGSTFNEAYENPQLAPEVTVRIANDDRPRQIYVRVSVESGTGALEAGVVLDEERTLLPLPVEVAKNFSGENEEPFYDPGDAAFSEAYFPLALGPGVTTHFTAIHLYQNWGAFPLKQISSIRFFEPYYHLSTGVTETNCYVPFFVGGRSGWMLPDFRTGSGVMWDSQPQFDAVGRNYFVSYVDADGRAVGIESTGSWVDSVGPRYSDATYTFETDDGKARVSQRYVEMPMTDQNRVFVHLRVEFDDTVVIDDPGNQFTLFRTIPRAEVFGKLGFLDDGGRQVAVEAFAPSSLGVIPLGQEFPYWSLFDSPRIASPGGGTNIGLLVQRAELTIGGRPDARGLAVRNGTTSDDPEVATNDTALTLAGGKVTFQRGDVIDLDLILLPFGGPELGDDQLMRDLRQDWAVRRPVVEAELGTVVPDRMVPTVRVGSRRPRGELARFTLTGGRGTTAFVVQGLLDYRPPVVEVRTASSPWRTLDATVKGYDGHQVVVVDRATFGFAFVDDVDGSPREYRVTAR